MLDVKFALNSMWCSAQCSLCFCLIHNFFLLTNQMVIYEVNLLLVMKAEEAENGEEISKQVETITPD